MSHWEVTIHSKDSNRLLLHNEGQLMKHDLAGLLGNERTQVELDLSLTTQIGNEWVKLRAAVRFTCNQDEETLDSAASMALVKVNEYACEGLAICAKNRQGVHK